MRASHGSLTAFLGFLLGMKFALIVWGVEPADFGDGVMMTLIAVTLVVWIAVGDRESSR